MENVKIFKVRGEYRMSEDDSFKNAKNIALELAEINLNTEIKHFLRKNFNNLDENNISEISEKFLKKNELRFIRENLPNNEMICYAELDAEINLIDLSKFIENFAVFKLEKKVSELEKRISELENIFKNSAMEYYNHGIDSYHSRDYDQAISDFTQAINLNPNYVNAYTERGYVYRIIGEIKLSEEDFKTARKLGWNG